jgi:SSS family solute:Na+ symporter
LLELTVEHIAGIIFTLIGITLVGIYSGKKIMSAEDFSVGGKNASAPIIAGTIMGTLIGGAATIGTAQLAFLYGFSAWWFTLGAGIGCLILAILFVDPLCRTGKQTVPQILVEEYGTYAGPISSIFVSAGIFLSIIAQMLSAVALLTAMFKISPFFASTIAILLMSAFVVFGGLWATGLVGIVKLALIYISMLAGGFIAFFGGGGLTGYRASFAAFPYFSLFGRGFFIDFAAGISVVIGVLSTQTYIQAVLSGKNTRESKLGALASAFIIPPIGIAGTFIGLFMKMKFPDIDPASAFPAFVLNYLNPWFGGVVLATLLIATVGGGAGLALGISTIMTNDIYKKYINKNADDSTLLKVTRMIVVGVLCLSLLFITGNMKSMILNWNFMSMGLRAASVFVPFCVALFFTGKVDGLMAVMSMVLGPLSILIGRPFLPKNFDPLFLGLGVSLVVVILGLVKPIYSSTEVKHKKN